MVTDPHVELSKKVTELETNVQRARTETRGLMIALVVAISTIDSSRRVDVMNKVQKIADGHRTSGEDDLANALERLLREM